MRKARKSSCWLCPQKESHALLYVVCLHIMSPFIFLFLRLFPPLFPTTTYPSRLAHRVDKSHVAHICLLITLAAPVRRLSSLVAYFQPLYRFAPIPYHLSHFSNVATLNPQAFVRLKSSPVTQYKQRAISLLLQLCSPIPTACPLPSSHLAHTNIPNALGGCI